MSENKETEAQSHHKATLTRNFQMQSAMAAAAMLGYGGGLMHSVGSPSEPETPARPCVNCGKEKRHNNAYCSSDCCREHKAKKNLRFALAYGGGKTVFYVADADRTDLYDSPRK